MIEPNEFTPVSELDQSRHYIPPGVLFRGAGEFFYRGGCSCSGSDDNPHHGD